MWIYFLFREKNANSILQNITNLLFFSLLLSLFYLNHHSVMIKIVSLHRETLTFNYLTFKKKVYCMIISINLVDDFYLDRFESLCKQYKDVPPTVLAERVFTLGLLDY